MASDTTDHAGHPSPFVEGSRWLHVWAEPIPGADGVCLAIQTETVGVKISPAPYVLLTPTECRKLLSMLEQLPGTYCQECKRSIPLD